MADPEIHEKLPLNKAKWVISTVRSKDLNLTLRKTLKKDAFQGRVALTATNEEEAREFEKAGAHLIFRPFMDATEQAADSLTYAMDFLPEQINWPISFLEVRIKSDAAVVGQSIRDLPLRTIAGVSILAVSRGGQVYYDTEPDFRIYPGDRLLIMGPPGGLKDAEEALNELELRREHQDKDRFEIAEIAVADHSELSGKSLMDISFRQKYGVNLIGIRRGKEQITAIHPAQQLLAGDRLIVIGKTEIVGNLKRQEPL
jgi:Trk K+ transport system NAD-binding subunit